jgi:hypothetical protein
LETGNKKLRIYHGPVNIGGIGRYLADWQRKKGVISDFIVWSDYTHRQNNHYNLHLDKAGRIRRIIRKLSFFLFCLFNYDLFDFYYARSFLPLNLDMPVLKMFGKKIVMTYCGMDVRLIEIERKRNPYATYSE